VLIVALTLIALVYTPLARYVSIPNPELDRRYGREILDTQARLSELFQDVLALKYYNRQLRKALGDQGARDTSLTRGSALSSPVSARRPDSTLSVAQEKKLSAADTRKRETTWKLDAGAAQGTIITAGASTPRLTFPLVPPTVGFISQHFDPSRNHFGLDYAGKQGAPIFAAADGYVVFSGWTYDDGNMLIISHGDRYLTIYKHNQSLFKSAHSPVKRGEIIGVLGTSGHTSLGPHLHFEVWKDGIPHDPEEYLLNVRKVQ
jgi:murein DD-endopeptidase MepM/ murein hydrolase activator NlpD